MSDNQSGASQPPDSFNHPSGTVAPLTHSELSLENMRPLVLVVPWLHPEMETASLPAEACFFDPGVHVIPDPDKDMADGSSRVPGRWYPATAPLSKGMATAFLRESSAFAREHGASRATLNTNALSGNDFYTGSALSIQSELTGGAPHRDNPAVRYQQLLLLAWQMEEQDMELRHLQNLVDAGWQKLDSALGVEDSEGVKGLSEGRSQVVFENREAVMPWNLVLEAMLFFAPRGTLLLTSHSGIIASLADVPEDPQTDPPESLSVDLARALSSIQAKAVRMVRAPGWKLVGATRCPAGKPWLERGYLLACLQDDEFRNGADFGERA